MRIEPLSHLAVLTGFAFAQPLFDLLGRNAEFFIAHAARPLDLIVFAATLCLLVPLPLMLTEAALQGWSPRLARAWHLGWISLLAGLVLLPALKKIGVIPELSLPWAAGILGAAFAAAYRGSSTVRSFLTLLSPAALLFPVLFLFFSPTSKLLKPAEVSRVQAGTRANGTPVIMLVFDELAMSSLMDEDGHINASRFPSFATLASRSLWFPKATTVADSTHFAVPAILTGRYPDGQRLPLLRDYPENLFTLLGDDYEMRVFESGTALCPPEICDRQLGTRRRWTRLAGIFSDAAVISLHLLLPSNLTTGLPDVTGTWRDFDQSSAPKLRSEMSQTSREDGPEALFAYFLETLRTDRRLFSYSLHFLHIGLPHLPWKYLPSGKTYGDIGASIYPHGLKAGGDWIGDDWEITQSHQRYLLQLGFTDHLLGELLSTLEEQGLFDRSLIVVTADHGVSFQPGESRRKATAGTFRDIMSVPLLVKLPGQTEGAISDRNVESIDILPTIVDVLEIENLRWPLEGRSILGDVPVERELKRIYATEAPGRLRWLEFKASAFDAPDDSISRAIETFGSGSDSRSLFDIGPYSELIGLSPQEVGIVDRPIWEAELDSSWAYDRVDPTSSFVPSQISGRLRSAQAETRPLELAITVNGKIHATTRSFEDSTSGPRFTAMVPEDIFLSRNNLVEVFVISNQPRGPVLVPTLQKSQLKYEVEIASSGDIEKITDSDGQSYAIAPDALKGAWSLKNGRIRGWARNLRSDHRADTVVAFVGDRFVTATSKLESRPPDPRIADVPFLADGGFDLGGMGLPLQESGVQGLRVFALDGNQATELDSGLSQFLFRLVRRGPSRREWIVTAQGKRITIRPLENSGSVDAARWQKDWLKLYGWTANVTEGKVPQLVIAFMNGEFVSSIRPRLERSDIVETFGESNLLRSGYELLLHTSFLDHESRPRLRIFAVSDLGSASELRISSGTERSLGLESSRRQAKKRRRTKSMR